MTAAINSTRKIIFISMEDKKAAANEWYLRGNEYRKNGDWKHAIDCYMEAVDIDSDSPAAEAKTMLEDILNFYNKDAYNP